MQSDLSSFAEGRSSPSRGYAEDHDDEGELSRSPPPVGRGRKCAKCGRFLNGGGLKAMGWPGLLCWDCFHSNLGRRDGRADASSDASGERNVGYSARR
jgi:hypothetical protein